MPIGSMNEVVRVTLTTVWRINRRQRPWWGALGQVDWIREGSGGKGGLRITMQWIMEPFFNMEKLGDIVYGRTEEDTRLPFGEVKFEMPKGCLRESSSRQLVGAWGSQ